jgi:exocyst complex component 5
MPGSARPQSPQSGDYRTRSIFPQGPTFNLDTFSSRDFIVKDFIESLSESAVPASRRSGPGKEQAFDPRPLIRSFEHALNRLSELSEELEGRETELSAAVRKAEAQHNSNIQSLSRRLDKSLDSFRNLDNSLNGFSESEETGGNEAVKIGEKLEELDSQRARARDAQFLIRCWLEICERGDIFTLEDRRQRARGEELVQVAKISRQLLKLSQRLDPKSWRDVNGTMVNGVDNADNARNPRLKYNTREIVEKFVETLEKDLLTQFDNFYKRDKYEGMREYAEVLQDFGGGASVIGTFVNQHPFFLERSQLATEEVDGTPEMWESLADPDAEIPEVELSLRDLVDDVKLVIEDESRVIKRAFSYYELVMGKFIQRIFQQSLQQRLEMVLEKANTVSSLAFLRSLQSARSYISSMVDVLKAHGLTEHPEPLSTTTALVLDQQFDDLFVPYFAGSSYVEREKKNLEELYSSLLFKFTIFHVSQSNLDKDYTKRVVSTVEGTDNHPCLAR